MAKQPDDQNPPPNEPKRTKIARQASKPTMIQRDEDAEVPESPLALPVEPPPNMSLEDAEEDIPVLAEADAAAGGSEVLMLEPAESAPAPGDDDDVPVLEEVSDALAESATPSSGADILPVVEDEAFASSAVPAAQPASGGARPPESDALPVEVEEAWTLPDEEVLGGEEVPEVHPPSSAALAQPVSDLAEAQAISDIAEAQPVSDIAEAQPASDVAAAEALFDEMEARPLSDIVAAQPADVTGADLPRADATGAEDVLGEELAEAQPASDLEGAMGAVRSDVFATAQPASGAEVLSDEPLAAGSHPSARVDSPIRTEPDEDALDLDSEPDEAPWAGKKHADLDVTEEVLAGEPGGVGSSAINWGDVGEGSDVAKQALDDETVAFDLGRAPVDDLLLGADDLLAQPDDSSSAVNLGGPPGKVKRDSGVDPVAEALESGVNLDDASPRHGPPSVEFDDILGDDAVEPPPSKKRATSKAADSPATALTDEDMEALGKRGPKKNKKSSAAIEADAAAMFAEDEETPSKRKKAGAAQDEDEAAAALFSEDEDEDEAVAEPVDDEDEAVAASVDDDEEAIAAAIAEDDDTATAQFDDSGLPLDEEAAPPRKKGKARVTVPEDEEEEEAASAPKGRGKTTAAVVAPSGPGCFGSLIRAGFFMLFGVVLAAGGVAAVAYFAPELIHEVPESPWVLKKPEAKIVPASPSQLAFTAIAARDYDKAFAAVKDDTDDSTKAPRGEARAFKVLKDRDLAKQPLDEAEKKEIAEAVRELRDGKNDTLANQIERGVREPELQTKLQEFDKSLTATNKALTQAKTEKQELDKKLTDIGTALVKAKIIDSPDEVAADKVEKVLKDFGDAQTALNGVNKLLKDADIKDAGPKGVEQLATAKKDLDDKLNEVNKALADAKVKEPGAKGVKEVLDTRAMVQKDRDELDTAIKGAYDELVKAKVVPAGGDPRKQLVEGTKLAREKGESPLALPLTQLGSSLSGLGLGLGRVVEKSVDTSRLAADLGIFQAREQFIQTPVQKLDTFAALLQDRRRKDPKELDAILRETDWVLTREAKLAPEARAKALYVTGLALRNQEKFDPARKALDGAVNHAGAKKAAWAKQAKQALLELTDARAYYLPQVEKLQSAGDYKGAIDEADLGLKALPGDGKLLAERGLARLEGYKGKGKLSAEAQQQIRNDGEAAAKSAGGAAQGTYILGLLDEEVGQFGKAEDQFRQALKLHKGSDDEASQYRIALARMLLRDRPVGAVPPVEAPPEKKDKDKEKDKEGRLLPPAAPGQQPTLYIHPMTMLALSAIISAQPGEELEPEQENPETAKRIRESIELAKVLCSSNDPRIREQGYTLLAQAAGKAGTQLTSASCLALAEDLLGRPEPKIRGTGLMLKGQGLVKQGRRTEGLKEYSRGLELLHPGLETREISRMVEDHPAFQHPDAANKPNPLLAEKHFGNGLHLYWARQYPEAEAQFTQAVGYYNQDARYLYFLGLAQLGQRTKLKRDHAYVSLDKGAQLEAQSRPSIAEINTSLERIQGDLRQFLNYFRNKGMTAAAVSP